MAISLVSGAFAQAFQGTLRQGSLANSVKVFVRPDAAFNGPLSNIVFVLQIPASITPKPTVTILNNPLSATFSTASWGTPEEVTNGGFYNYRFGATTTGAPATVLAANAELEVLELSINGGPLGVTEKLRLAHLADGGPESKYQFYVEANTDRTNYRQMFYGSGVRVPASPAADDGAGYAMIQYIETSENIALPVKFLSFFAIKNGDDAKLNWTVESDENNNFFEVERSTDGRVYRPLNKVSAKANGRSVNTYESADFALSKLGSNQVFYRIKQVDRDGQITYSTIRNLNAVRRGTPVQLFPNPVKSITKLVIDADAPGKASITIRDMGGKLVQQINTLLVRGMNQQDLNVASLASGEYTVLVVGEGFNHTLKLNKIN